MLKKEVFWNLYSRRTRSIQGAVTVNDNFVQQCSWTQNVLAVVMFICLIIHTESSGHTMLMSIYLPIPTEGHLDSQCSLSRCKQVLGRFRRFKHPNTSTCSCRICFTSFLCVETVLMLYFKSTFNISFYALWYKSRSLPLVLLKDMYQAVSLFVFRADR